MTSCAVCFTTDPGYLFPTLIAARQARRNLGGSAADVLIFSFDADQRTDEIFSRICRQEDIQLISLRRDAINGAPMTLARLFLDRFVPDKYTQLLYLDGDIQIAGLLDPLIDAQLPEGYFLAASDPMTFLNPGPRGTSSAFATHVADLGLPASKTTSYFNAGVLRISRRGWGELGSLAWDAYTGRPSGWRFLDQDVLNLVGADRRLPMSLRWNFPIFLRNARVERSIQPHIYHFMSAPKPWNLACPPWSEVFCTPYLDAVQMYPELQAYNLAMPLRRRLRYHLQQRYKQARETMSWGYGLPRKRVIDYEANGVAPLRRSDP